MSEIKLRSDLLVMQEMSEKNMDIACALDVLKFNRTKHGGLVTVGVPSPQFDHLINQAATGKITHYGILYVINKEQFDILKKTPDEYREKAAKWDALRKKMEEFYEDDSEADLGVIGETAAMAFGYL
jgi:hypothetical protein